MVYLSVNVEEITSSSDDSTKLLECLSIKRDSPGLIWIQGANGAGKSLLASIISGKAFFEKSGLNVKGSVILKTATGQEVIANKAKGARDYAEHVSYLPQKLGSSLLAIHYQDDICFGLEGRFPSLPGHGWKEKDRVASSRLASLIQQLTLWAHLTKGAAECSYSEIRRVEFAAALSPYEDVVILDEPFSGLDFRWQKIVSEALNLIPPSYESIWIVTSHEPPEKYGVSADLIITLPDREPNRQTFGFVAQTAITRFESQPVQMSQCIELQDLLVERYNSRGHRVELTYFRAEPAVITWLQGANAAGKSTVAKVLAGLTSNSRALRTHLSGAVIGRQYPQGFLKAPSDTVKMALQDPFRSFIWPTVEEDILKPVFLLDKDADLASDLSKDFLQRVNAGWGRTERKAVTYAFGQLKFLQLLLFPSCAEVLVLDEPLQGLHPDFQPLMLSTLRAIAKSGRIVVCTCQELPNHSEEERVYSLGTQ